jgi:hypothetical protein
MRFYGMRKSTSMTVVLVVTGAALALPPAAVGFAQDATTQAAGGTGGDVFTVSCGSSKAMVGVQGRWSVHPLIGGLVNSVQPLCVAVDAGGKWIGTPTAADRAGVDDGGFVKVLCSSGSAVGGITGRSGIYIDQLAINCAPLGEYGHLSGTADAFPSGLIGDETSSNGTHFGPFLCPDNKPGKGLTGKAHEWIDRVALICNFPSTPAAVVRSVSPTTPSIVGGNPMTGRVQLNAAAPSGGTSVGISVQINASDEGKIPTSPISPNPTVVSSGQRSANFSFSTNPVATTLTVRLNPSPRVDPTVSTTFDILPPSLATLSLSSNQTTPGGSVTGTVGLNGAAPPGGVLASLTSSVPATATVPATVAVAQGQSSATFPVTLSSASGAGCTVLNASGVFTPSGGTATRTTILLVLPPRNSAFTLGMTNGSASAPASLTVAVANSELAQTVTLSSSNPTLVGVPSTVSIPAGSLSAGFTISVLSRPPSGVTCAVISANDKRGVVNSMIVSVDPSNIRRLDRP